ncbi:hypothetical protein RJT34_32940 [Clitoria ternatea]|uniref:Uncharacterized protein n=1 Tax=Clitoria ternatea TaxID=43366 RepID=A0AAN9EZ84_CLITE
MEVAIILFLSTHTPSLCLSVSSELLSIIGCCSPNVSYGKTKNKDRGLTHGKGEEVWDLDLCAVFDLPEREGTNTNKERNDTNYHVDSLIISNHPATALLFHILLSLPLVFLTHNPSFWIFFLNFSKLPVYGNKANIFARFGRCK